MIIGPAVKDLKEIFRNKATGTLNEIKRVTVEKLTNKIIRSFCLDLVFFIPLLFIVLLQYRAAAMTYPTSGCYGDMANWLLVYVSIMIGFTFVRLLRLPVMRLFSHKWYMFYVVFYTVA